MLQLDAQIRREYHHALVKYVTVVLELYPPVGQYASRHQLDRSGHVNPKPR